MKRFISAAGLIILFGGMLFTSPQQGYASPPLQTGPICGQQCVTQTITATIPPLEETHVVLDVLFLMDVTGSMGGVLSTVSQSAVEILTGIRDISPETHFGVATFADYGDFPWKLNADLSGDSDAIANVLADTTDTYTGGDTPESYGRALYESLFVSWRPEATKLIILFGDAPAHDPDPGRDGQYGTSDDLVYADVLQQLADAGIQIIAVDSDLYLDTAEWFKQAADVTGGSYVDLQDVGDVPRIVTEEVGAAVVQAGELHLEVSDPAYSGWVVASPSTIEFPPEGGEVSFQIQICPAAANAPAGQYSVPIRIIDDQATEYQSLTVDVSYEAVCTDIFIADHADDTGQGCSDKDRRIYWESPDIVIRHADDQQYTSEQAVSDQPQSVYVQVHNLSSQPQDAEVVLYTSESLLVADWPADWVEVGRVSVTLPAKESLWTPAFSWTPSSAVTALRAEVSAAADPVSLPNDIACDNNIAQVNRMRVPLDIVSAGAGMVGGEISLTLLGPQGIAYQALDLEVGTDATSGADVSLYLEQSAFKTWEVLGRLSGGEVDQQRIRATESGPLLLTNVVGGPNIRVDGTLSIFAPSSQPSTLSVRLIADDRDIVGGTLDLVPVGQDRLPDSAAPPLDPTPTGWDWLRRMWLPIALTVVLFGLVVFIMIRDRLKKQEESY